MTDVDVQELRQASEEFSVVLHDMASLQERIKLLQEEIAAQVNEENNRSLFVLTIVTVLALPINIIAGLLGMNVGGVPLAQHAQGSWSASSPPSLPPQVGWHFESGAKSERYTAPAQLREAPCSRTS